MEKIGTINLSQLSNQKVVANADSKVVSQKNTDSFNDLMKQTNSSKSTQNSSKDVAPVKKTNINTTAKKKENVVIKESKSVMSNGNQNKMEISDIKENLEQIVKDELSLDDSQLQDTLNALGITILDLLQPDVLKQFVLQINGGQENIDFLTNENILSDYTNLMQSFESFVDQNSEMLVQTFAEVSDEKSLLNLFEILDEPVSFNEFLKQNGITLDSNPNEESQFMVLQENEISSSDSLEQSKMDSIVVLGEETGKVDNVIAENDNILQSLNNDNANQEIQDLQPGSKEVIVQSTDDDSKKQSFNQEEKSSENGDASFMMKDNSAEQMKSTGLFAEQFQVTQGDVSKLFENTVLGNQKMQQMIDIVNQVSNQIKTTVHQGSTSMELQLNPENLGKVFLSVASKDGIMTANFRVQSEEAKQALESQIYTLRENLEAKNIKVASVEVEVDVSDFSFSQSNQMDGEKNGEFGKQNKRKFRYDTEDDVIVEDSFEEDDEKIRKQVMAANGSSVDFTA